VLIRANRTFYEIVNSILYKDTSILSYTENVIKFKEVLSWLFVPYARHIRTLHMWGGSSRSDSNAWEEISVSFLSQCVNLTTIALYFRFSHGERRWIKLRDVVLTLMTKGELKSLVFYNYEVYDGGLRRYCEYNVHPILQTVADSEIARNRLKSLHLALSSILPSTESLIRSSFPNLETLVIEKTFWGRPKFDRLNGWKRLDSLTRLQIRHSSIIAPDIPDLVALFPALRELLFSALLSSEPLSSNPDNFSSRYPVGWHLLPKALCNTHRPLEWIHVHRLHIHHQIEFIGVVPTKMLIATGAEPEKLLSLLKIDTHLFPGMQVLRRQKGSMGSVVPDWEVDNVDERISPEAGLKEWCTARNIEEVLVTDPRRLEDMRLQVRTKPISIAYDAKMITGHTTRIFREMTYTLGCRGLGLAV
jgi:hypothetical protein